LLISKQSSADKYHNQKIKHQWLANTAAIALNTKVGVLESDLSCPKHKRLAKV